METNTQEPGINLDSMLSDFDFVIDESGQAVTPQPDPKKPEGAEGKTEEESAAEAAAAKKAEEEAAAKAAEEEAAKAAAGKDKGDEGKEKPTPAGQSTSFYASLAKKMIEKGRWDKNLAIEDEDGNQIPIEEVSELDENTFFEIEEAIRAEEEEKRKEAFISTEGLDDRRKTLIEIVQNGGDLSQIFQNQQQVEQYINPWANFDLDDEAVQANVYKQALIQYKGLDPESAQVLVEKAKKDFTLDEKAKTFVKNYTDNFDKFVESKKQELLQKQQDEKKQLAEFKKNLSEEYKNYGLKDTLVRKLTSSAVTKAEDGFEIDSVYSEKMSDPKEAAELVLFLQDKEAYLEYKMKETKVEEQKKTRKIFKMVSGQKATKKSEGAEGSESQEDEFSFKVDV